MPKKLTPHSTIAQNAEILSTSVGDETALMSCAQGRYYSLDPVASDIWQRLQTPTTIDRLSVDLSEGYAGDPEQIKSDLAELCQKFAEEELIDIDAGDE
jgi:hypothetical protein